MLSQIIVKFDTKNGNFAFLGHKLRGNVRCSSLAHWKALGGLPISDNWPFSLGITAEVPGANTDWKEVAVFLRGE